MPETTHRRDINSGDFRVLAKFCATLIKLSENDDQLLWYLHEIAMYLPVWCTTAGEWKLSRYKEFRREALGITTADFRRICRFMAIKESVVINVLFRMSILSLTSWQSVLDPPKYRREFTGVPYRNLSGDAVTATGFVLEMRRCEGHFKTFHDDESWYSECHVE